MMPRSDQTAWLLISTALVMLTIPGVALFYGGLVRRKNVLNTMGMAFLACVLVTLQWLLWGETLAVDAVSSDRSSAMNSPLLEYHTMAGALALALLAGALVERIRFSFFLVFGSAWVAFVYAPIAHWQWGRGWLANMGSLDFAGGAVIHMSAGVTALVAALLVGPRSGYGRIEMMPNHLPFALCGAALMWVGWCGFSAGMGDTSMATATGAFVAIQMAAASASLTWTAAEWIQRDKPTALGTVSGAVAGLVAIAPGAGYVSPLSAVVIGIGAGALGYMVVNFVKPILRYDDSLDVFGIHGVGGTWGMIATGLFASTAVNPDGSDGLFYGYPYQFFAQLVSVLVVWAFAAVMTGVLITAIRMIVPPRVDEEAETVGLDLTLHREKGYS